MIKLVSFKPRQVKHRPDEFEKVKLLLFEKDPSCMESWGKDIIKDQRYFRYMIPLRIEAACLSCHGDPKGEIDISGNPKEGYKVGDLAGALTISIPNKIKDASLRKGIRDSIVFALLILIFSAMAIIFQTTPFCH